MAVGGGWRGRGNARMSVEEECLYTGIQSPPRRLISAHGFSSCPDVRVERRVRAACGAQPRSSIRPLCLRFALAVMQHGSFDPSAHRPTAQRVCVVGVGWGLGGGVLAKPRRASRNIFVRVHPCSLRRTCPGTGGCKAVWVKPMARTAGHRGQAKSYLSVHLRCARTLLSCGPARFSSVESKGRPRVRHGCCRARHLRCKAARAAPRGAACPLAPPLPAPPSDTQHHHQPRGLCRLG